MSLKKLKHLTALVVALAFGMVFTTTPAYAQTISVVGDATIGVGLPFTVTGECDVNATTNDVTFTLTSGATVRTLATVDADAAGNYTANLAIPSDFPIGTATLTVTCAATGESANTAISVSAPVVLTADIGVSDTIVFPGQTITITGFCPTAAIGQNVVIEFGQDAMVNVLATVALTTNNAFSASVTIPSAAVTGDAAVIVANCGTTNVQAVENIDIVEVAQAPGDPAPPADDAGDVGGGEEAADPATPTGAVDAGAAALPVAQNLLLGLSLLAAGALTAKKPQQK